MKEERVYAIRMFYRMVNDRNLAWSYSEQHQFSPLVLISFSYLLIKLHL